MAAWAGEKAWGTWTPGRGGAGNEGDRKLRGRGPPGGGAAGEGGEEGDDHDPLWAVQAPLDPREDVGEIDRQVTGDEAPAEWGVCHWWSGRM